MQSGGERPNFEGPPLRRWNRFLGWSKQKRVGWEGHLKLAAGQCSYHGFQRFNRFHTAAILASLCAVFMCAAPAVTQAQVAGGSITGTARGDSGSQMPGVRISIKD